MHINYICTSLHSFKMYLRNLRYPLIKHYYCARFFAYQENDGPRENCTVCENNMDKSNKRYFLECQLKTN